MQLYMVVERVRTDSARDVYDRASKSGRLLPTGLEYVENWVSVDFKICYQLMRTGDEKLFQTWIREWEDLVDFEVIPVRTSAEASELMSRLLTSGR